MHVAILVKEFPPDVIGGTETQTCRMARELARSGHDVTVYTKAYDRSGTDPHADAPFTVKRIPNWRRSAFLSTLTFVLLATLYLLRDARSLDVLQCMMIYPTGSVGQAVNAVTGLPYFAWIRGGDFYFAKENSVKRRLLRSVLADAHVLVQAQPIADDVREAFPGVDADLAVLGNGVDVPDETADGDAIVYVGRLADQKGVDNLLRAAAGLDERLLVVGDGPEHEALESLAADLAVDVTFAGLVDPDAVQQYLRQGKLFVLPSKRGEGLPNAVLEAMAAGLPVLVTDTAGTAAAVREGETGAVVAPDDVAALREQLSALCDDADLDRMGEQAREYAVSNHSWESLVSELDDVYRRVTED